MTPRPGSSATSAWPGPRGYRKAIRLMDLADRFNLPVVALVDTPGAYPGKGAEERGQSEAIARSTEKCLALGVPMVSVVIGEGGSGGAVAFASSNRLIMLEHSIYSVISPEGCASILWKDAEKMREAAEALRLTAQDLAEAGHLRPHRQGARGRCPASPRRGDQPCRQRHPGPDRQARRDGPQGAPQGPPREVSQDGLEGSRRLGRGASRPPAARATVHAQDPAHPVSPSRALRYNRCSSNTESPHAQTRHPVHSRWLGHR